MPASVPRRYVPRSIYGRAALILLVPVIAVQLVVSVVFIQRLYADVTQQMTRGVVLELARLTDLADAAPDAAAALKVARPLADALNIALTLPDPAPIATDARAWWDISGRSVTATLHDRLPGLSGVDLAQGRKRVLATVATRHGPLRLDFDRGRVSASNPHQLLVLMVFTGALMTLVSILFLRNQLRPIRRLARAAEAFGKGRSVPYRPSGAIELRAAGGAFLDMRARIERQIEQRTLMLSGVSHDLRTPLTRLRLGLEMAPPGAETDAMIADVAEMEAMLNAFLDFARSDSLGETEPTDPAALTAEAVEGARRSGLTVALRPAKGEGTVPMRRAAVARALANLIGNAARHGTRVEVGCTLGERAAVFTVEDDGPGIRPAAREEALRPFTRLDTARGHSRVGVTADAGVTGSTAGGPAGVSAAIGGGNVGLGLAIAIDIARQHGGTLRLDVSPTLGGLKADLVIAR